MADAFTTNLGMNKQEVGQHANTWGTNLNTNLDYADAKFGDRTSIATTGGATTLSATEQRVAKVKVTGALISGVTINFNATGGFWIFENATTNDFSVTAKVTGQTGVTIGRGERALLVYNGTDIERVHPQDPAAPIALTDGATVAVNLALIPNKGFFSLTAAGNRQLVTPTNLVDGKIWAVIHRASGADRTLSLDSGYAFGTDITALTATTSAKADIILFRYDATIAKSLVIGVVKGY